MQVYNDDNTFVSSNLKLSGEQELLLSVLAITISRRGALLSKPEKIKIHVFKAVCEHVPEFVELFTEIDAFVFREFVLSRRFEFSKQLNMFLRHEDLEDNMIQKSYFVYSVDTVGSKVTIHVQGESHRDIIVDWLVSSGCSNVSVHTFPLPSYIEKDKTITHVNRADYPSVYRETIDKLLHVNDKPARIPSRLPKLTEDKLQAIKSLLDTKLYSNLEISKKCAISPSTVSRIKTGAYK